MVCHEPEKNFSISAEMKLVFNNTKPKLSRVRLNDAGAIHLFSYLNHLNFVYLSRFFIYLVD
jgi:hypothetical protein